MHPREALDGRSVEADAFVEGTFEFGRCDRYGLQGPQDVGEPQPNEPNVAFFDCAKDEFSLLLHGPILSCPVLRAR